MSNKILFAGDPHGCFANIISAVCQYKPEAVVLLGDYNLEMPLERYLAAIIGMTKVYWIAGNHDFDSTEEHENLFHSALSYNCLNLKVVDVGGFRIAGLSGIFIKRIWLPGDIPKWIDRQHWLKHQTSSSKPPLHLGAAIWHHQWRGEQLF
jgi:predicted phosphodiesterase